MFAINSKDLERLGPVEFTELLEKLLLLEAREHNIEASNINVPKNITISDGGIDGWIEVPQLTISSSYLCTGKMGFQVKATRMTAAKCYSEILTNDGYIKPSIVKLLNENGTYVLFINHEVNDIHNSTWRQKIKQAIYDGAKKIFAEDNPSTAEKQTNEYLKEIDLKIKIYDTTHIYKWVNKYLSAIKFVWEDLGKTLPAGIMSWEDLGATKGYIRNRFFDSQDKRLENHKIKLVEQLLSLRNVARISGLPGLGKSRLAYEIFHKPEIAQDTIQQKLYQTSVYIDASLSSYYGEIERHLQIWINDGLSGILVVDNCESELHQRLYSLVQNPRSKFSLLTIGYESVNNNNFILQRLDDETLTKIITDFYRSLNTIDIKQIIRFSQGYPGIAVSLSQMKLQSGDFYKLNDTQFINKLLWSGTEKDGKAYDVILACSLFSYMGVKDTKADQYEFVAKFFCKLEADEFYKLIRRHFFKRGVIAEVGRYFIITPEPLAWALAANWWNEHHPNHTLNLITLLFETQAPTGLKRAFLQRLEQLVFSLDVKQFLSNLCKPNSFLSKKENFIKYIELIVCMTSIVPETTLDLLKSFITSNNIELIKVELKNHIQFLKLALQKLCLTKSTFTEAFTLLKIVDSDHEFHQRLIKLAEGNLVDGTNINISFEQQLYLLKTVACSDNIVSNMEYITGDMENNNSLAKNEQTNVTPYNFGETARHKIIELIQRTTDNFQLEKLISTCGEIISSTKLFWPEALIEINLLKYKGLELERLMEIEKALQPQTIQDNLIWFICYAYQIKARISGIQTSTIDIAYQITTFANNCAKDFNWLNYLELIYAHPQSGGELFGRIFATALKIQPKLIEEFLTKSLKAINKLKSERKDLDIDLSLLNAFITGIKESQPNIAINFMKSIQNEQPLRFMLFKLLASLELSIKDRINLILDKDCLASSLKILITNFPLHTEKAVEVVLNAPDLGYTSSPPKDNLIIQLVKMNDISKTYAALYLLSRTLKTLNSTDKIRYKDLLKKWRLSSLLAISKTSLRDIYHIQPDGLLYWVEIIQDCLNNFPKIVPEIKLTTIINTIVELFNHQNMINENICKNLDVLINVLLNRDKRLWHETRKALVSDTDFIVKNALVFCLNSLSMRQFINEKLNYEQIAEWVQQENQMKVKQIIAQGLPLIKDDSNDWNQLALSFFEYWGHDINNLDLIDMSLFKINLENQLILFSRLNTHEHEAVKNWAKLQTEQLKEYIAAKMQQSQEASLGANELSPVYPMRRDLGKARRLANSIRKVTNQNIDHKRKKDDKGEDNANTSVKIMKTELN